VAILVHDLSILGHKRGIQCTCETATLIASSGKMMNSDQATRCLVSSLFFFKFQNDAVLG